MGKWFRVVLAVVLLVSFGLATSRLFWLPEPSYHGKPLSTWLADFDFESLHSPDNARLAVRSIGTNSFALLRSMLRARDPLWKKGILALERKQSVLQFHLTKASIIRYRAVQGYTVLGGAAKQDVNALIQLLESESDVEVRSDVATALGGIGPEAKAAIPLLWKAAQDQSSQFRTSALSALVNIKGWPVPEKGF